MESNFILQHVKSTHHNGDQLGSRCMSSFHFRFACPKHIPKVQHPPAVNKNTSIRNTALFWLVQLCCKIFFGTSSALFTQLPNMRSFSIRQHQRMGTTYVLTGKSYILDLSMMGLHSKSLNIPRSHLEELLVYSMSQYVLLSSHMWLSMNFISCKWLSFYCYILLFFCLRWMKVPTTGWLLASVSKLLHLPLLEFQPHEDGEMEKRD